MKFFNCALLTLGLVFLTSCATSSEKQCPLHSSSCQKGECKSDKSCCQNKCQKCDGKTSCKDAQCDMTKS